MFARRATLTTKMAAFVIVPIDLRDFCALRLFLPSYHSFTRFNAGHHSALDVDCVRSRDIDLLALKANEGIAVIFLLSHSYYYDNEVS
jgi:hypothetical protein